jgi:hypothetical protein
MVAPLNENRFTNVALMPKINSKYSSSVMAVDMDKQIDRTAPIQLIELFDQKSTKLNYDSNLSLVRERSDKMIPSFITQTGRKTLLPGQKGQLRAESTIEDANLGVLGQGYGLASYTKGQ